MKIQFLGAAKTVTGSCYVIEACGKRFAVDCGMHQGNKAIEARNRDASVYRATELDFVLLTHAHIDHSGLLPLIAKEGFRGQIYCTAATADLIELMLEDSAHIQEMEALYQAKKYSRRGLKHPPSALYTTDDAKKACEFVRPVDLHRTFEPAPGISVTYYEAGHILGSGSLRLEVNEDDKKTSLIFSGDIGRPKALILNDPEVPPAADYVFMESTYGDRDHKDAELSLDELAEAISYSYSRGGNVVIPAFAVERTQEMLVCLLQLRRDGRLPEDMRIFVDSPLAIRATEVFMKHPELVDEETKAAVLDKNGKLIELPNLSYTLSRDESEAISGYNCPAIIISASGMCNAGRIKHHLRNNIWRPECSIVFVGYQAVGTPGRTIVDGGKKVTLFGEDVAITAKIFCINNFSAHAGQSQLLEWLKPLAASSPKVVLVHGEEKAQQILAGLIKERYGITAMIPGYLEEAEIVGSSVEHIVQNETKAHPRINWEFLIGEISRKWAMVQSKDLSELPWAQQTELQERMEKADYALTQLLSRL